MSGLGIRYADAAPAGFVGYGYDSALPYFLRTGDAYALGSLLTGTPTVNLVDGGSPAVITGSPGTTGLAVNATNKLVFPEPARTAFANQNSITLFSVFKATGQQGLIGDPFSGSGLPWMLALANSTTDLRGSGGDGTNTFAQSVVAGGVPDMSLAWNMVFLDVTLTTLQVHFQRTSTGRLSGGLSTKTSGAVGSTSNPIQVGGNMGTGIGTSNATHALCGWIAGATSSVEKDALFARCSALMTFIGETL